MRNLELYDLQSNEIGDLFQQAEHFTQITDNSYQSLLSNYLYFIKNGQLYELQIDNLSDLEQSKTDRNDLQPIIDHKFGDVIAMKILPIECHLHIVTKRFLYILDRTRFDSCQIQYKIEFPYDITVANWSPIDDILITVTHDGRVTVIPLNGIYDDDYQTTSHVDDPIPDTVYVGWGSENTQFRGSEGKKSNKSEEIRQIGGITDEKPRISWRGNGELFAINYFKDKRRLVTIFDKNGRAQFRCCCDETPGLQPAIAWRPLGNMLATIVDMGDGLWECVVFEKNGQKRFSFSLQIDQGDGIVDMKWSWCSRILAILTGNPATDRQTLHLYTTSNYQWYQKQKIVFPVGDLLNFEFLQQSPWIRLRIVTKSAVIAYRFRDIIHHNGAAICAVINGKSVQITDFNESIIPPPLYLNRIETGNSINFLAISANPVKIAVINSENLLQIYRICGELVDEYDLNRHDHFRIPLNFNDLHWTDPENLVFTGNQRQIFRYHYPSGNCEILWESDQRIGKLTTLPQGEDVIKQLPQLYVLKPDVDAIEFGNNIILTTTNTLEYCGRKLATNVNSFTTCGNYLLYTTKINQLFCDNLETIDTIGCYCRTIEQGARIVCCIPNTSMVVMQLPRGNLETISCRSIAIDILDNLLETNHWRQALDFIKTEKLSVNLLYDLNSARFCGNIENFVRAFQQIIDLTRICLEFDPTNSLKTLYKTYNKRSDHDPIKIERILGGLFDYFDTIEYIEYLPAIVVLKYHFYTLKDALIYLQDAYRRFVGGDSGVVVKLQDAIHNLRNYGCDDLKLFDTCLILYDLDLAKFVLNYLQIDPRYYQQLLEKFENYDEIERRYHINCYLKQPQLAVMYLVYLPHLTEDDLCSFIKTHNLYRQAYQYVRKDSKYYQIISRLYGDYLSLNRLHQLAGIVLKRARLYSDAFEQFRQSLDWRHLLELCEILGFNRTKRDEIISELCRDLITQRSYKDAAYLYENCLDNPDLAIKTLLTHHLWYDALFLMRKYHLDAQFMDDFRRNLQQFKSLIIDKLQELFENFTNYCERLVAVRSRNLQKFHNDDGGGDFDDLYSEASTVTRSNRTRTSTQSSKNRRKDERKRQDLRAGGLYEDIALIRALYLSIQEIYAKQEDVSDCCLLLLQETEIDFVEINDLYNLYCDGYKKVQNSLNTIWPPYFYKKSEQVTDQELVDLKNFEFLDVQFRVAPQNPGELKIDIFK